MVSVANAARRFPKRAFEPFRLQCGAGIVKTPEAAELRERMTQRRVSSTPFAEVN
jgi:hypothetical protein